MHASFCRPKPVFTRASVHCTDCERTPSARCTVRHTLKRLEMARNCHWVLIVIELSNYVFNDRTSVVIGHLLVVHCRLIVCHVKLVTVLYGKWIRLNWFQVWLNQTMHGGNIIRSGPLCGMMVCSRTHNFDVFVLSARNIVVIGLIGAQIVLENDSRIHHCHSGWVVKPAVVCVNVGISPCSVGVVVTHVRFVHDIRMFQRWLS